MPIYEYRSSGKGCVYCRQSFQASHGMNDKPLDNCPKCGGPVERIFSPFSMGKNILSKSHLKEHGFTKLVKDGEGGYREEK